jgi:hypothetical protein
MRTRALWRDIRCGERLGVPIHETAFADDMKANRKPPAAQERIAGAIHEGQRRRVAREHFAREDDDAIFAGEAHRLVGSENDPTAGVLQACVHAIEVKRAGA